MEQEYLFVYDRPFLKTNRGFKVFLVASLVEYSLLYLTRESEHRVMETRKALPYEAWEIFADYFSQMYQKEIKATDLIKTEDEMVDNIIEKTKEMEQVEHRFTEELYLEIRFVQRFLEEAEAQELPFFKLRGLSLSITQIYTILTLYIFGQMSKEECEERIQYFKELNPSEGIDNILLRRIFSQVLDHFWQVYSQMYPPDQYISISQLGNPKVAFIPKNKNLPVPSWEKEG